MAFAGFVVAAEFDPEAPELPEEQAAATVTIKAKAIATDVRLIHIFL